MTDSLNGQIAALQTHVEHLRSSQQEMKESLGEFRQEVREGMRELREGTKERMDGHSERIRFLEDWRNRLSGAKGVIIALWTSLLAVAVTVIGLVSRWFKVE